jgi:hypothetical protein
MQKKTIIWTAVATTAAVIAIYYIRKKRTAGRHASPDGKPGKHITNVFSRAKGIASGEYTL